MNSIPAELDELLSLYLDEEEEGEAALRRAGEWAGKHPLDIADLFDWVQRYPASKERRQRAQVVLRAALGMRLVPGPVCRPTPP
ncbi:hypothetical protein B1810_09225 [Panacagrimonas perspica]|uniref:hypothetical protein n=1 Tax=Panacagrimonas perspica TaxID=381431 RepID=UPI00105BA3AD|nr:hypothetical protein [Panacagrimonas perspica]THD03429.1 hypothetical protein B1810_09225 [Panacagrimonas perspica]